MPGFDWAAWAKPQGIDRSPAVILAQPSFFKAFAAMVPDVPVSTWRAWLVSRYVTAAAPYLSEPFDTARFDFFGSGDGRRGRRNADGDDENRDPVSSATVAYLVRAVTPGSFVHPPATVEDMYRPDRFARTASGRLEIKSKE